MATPSRPQSVRPPPSARRVMAGLAPRIVVIAAFSAGIGLGLMYLVLSHNVVRLSLEMGSELATQLMTSGDGLGCRTSPETWQFEFENGSRLFAYEARTHASSNPAAPDLAQDLIDTIDGGERVALDSSRHDDPAVHVLFRVAERGPCSLLSVRWLPNLERRREQRLTLGAIVMLALLVITVLGILWVVRPLLRRISYLANSAQTVGDDAQFPASGPIRADELGAIELGLRSAHDRIMTDRAALESKNDALTRHLSDIAHDLRTPISSLQLALERLTEGDDESERWLEAALSDAVYLENLTDNLQMAARIQEGLVGTDAPPETNLVDVADRVYSRMGPLARQRHISLEQGHPDRAVWIRCDPTLAERAIGNLVHNSIRYGEPGGHVAILLEADAGRFSLEVLDDGPGVPPAEIHRLSERTFRGDAARQRQVQGAGLGLAITAEFCARADVTLTFEAVDPRGLRARISGRCSEGNTQSGVIVTS